jgi:hypothetical protein
MDVVVNFLQSHWHCIVPALAIAGALFFQSLGKKNQDEKNRDVE